MHPRPSRSPRVKNAALSIPVLALAIALAGCGDDDSDTLSGPASVMPGDAPIYFEFSIRPEGEQAENLDVLLAEFGEIPLIGDVEDPGGLIIEQLEAQAEAAGVDFSYAEDVEPWLGEKVGFSISSAEDAEESFVAAIETSDEEQAFESIQSLFTANESIPYEEGEYEGVSYLSAPGDQFRVGAFDGHVVLAPAAEFEAAIDGSEDDSLAASDKLTDSLANLGDDRLAAIFVDLAQFEALAETPEDAEEFAQAQAVAPEFFEGGIAISAGVSASDQVYIDYATPLFEGQPEVAGSPLLETAPGDSLGAAALADIGGYVGPIVDLFERAQEEGAELEDFPEEGIAEAFESETGIALDDAAAAIGDASLWVRGDLPDGLEVAGEIEVTDTETAAELIEAAEAKARDEGEAKIGPPVGGSEVGFSALEPETLGGISTAGPPGLKEDQGPLGFDPESDGFEESQPEPGEDLPFVNIELDGDVIRYGFFLDEEAATASDPDGAGDFSGAEAFAAGQEAVGDDFEYVGAIDLQPILDEYVGELDVTDAVLGGGSPEELAGPFLAGKLGVVAFGQRYEDDVSISRYVLRLAE